MATSKTTLVSVDNLIFADNVRSEECLRLPEMVASITRDGFQPDCPLTLSAKDDDKYLVLRGNRRGLALRHLMAHDSAIFRASTTGGKVPCIVHSGLSEYDEAMLRIDHAPSGDRVPLDDWSVFLAIRQLVRVGMDTQSDVAEKLGIFHEKGKSAGKPNRSFVQKRFDLARCPKCVQEEMHIRCIRPNDTFLRWEHIQRLRKAYGAEIEAHPDGDGPVFRALWEDCLKAPEAPSADNGKALTPKAAKDKIGTISTPLLRRAVLALTGQGQDTLASIDTAMLAIASAQETLDRIKAYLGDDDYAQLIIESRIIAEDSDAPAPTEAPA